MKKLVFIIICIAGLSACNNDAGKTATADSLAAHPDTTAQAVFVRQNIYSLPASDPIILAYKKGLAVMQLRDKADPTSWSYQAAIHGTTSIIKKPAWSTCQHGTFFFLSWHRMFLYYFERIVRKASGYPKFALPYWNYSDDPSQAALPLVFRQPANASNILYVSSRDGGVNKGDPLQPSVVEYKKEMEEVDFTGADDLNPGFGGVTVSSSAHEHKPHGPIEGQPHDAVHGAIAGLMNDPATAGMDPIFWLHHANLDRLWEKWIRSGSGRANPVSDQVWMQTKFTFFDEDGNKVEMSGKDILNTEKQLGYIYDEPGPASEEAQQLFVKPSEQVGKKNIVRTELLSHSEVQTNGVQTTIQLGAPKDAIDQSKELFLRLDNITYSMMPKGVFEVYLNLPAGQQPDWGNMYYAGNISVFGFMSPHGDDHDMSMGNSVVLHLTQTYQKLKTNHVDLKNLRIVIVHKAATRGLERDISGDIHIQSIKLVATQ